MLLFHNHDQCHQDCSCPHSSPKIIGNDCCKAIKMATPLRLWANERPVSRSCDHSQPIRDLDWGRRVRGMSSAAENCIKTLSQPSQPPCGPIELDKAFSAYSKWICSCLFWSEIDCLCEIYLLVSAENYWHLLASLSTFSWCGAGACGQRRDVTRIVDAHW